MLDEYKRFIIDDYSRKPVFASFLPGLSGKKGIPIWSFYCNRGQGITSFGTQNKDNSIMEFYPAHAAYQLVRTHGFRTFIKQNGKVREAFSDDGARTRMYIGFNTFSLEDEKDGILTEVSYCTLPSETTGALVRIVRVTNKNAGKVDLSVLDGMPALNPFGVSMQDQKELGQTVTAWMQVEDHDSRLPYYRVRASIVDSIDVQEITKGNFAFAFDDGNDLLNVFVDPEAVFDYDLSFIDPVAFKDGSFRSKPQNTSNNVPCAFFEQERELEAGESMVFYEVYGNSNGKKRLYDLAERIKTEGAKEYFARKWDEASGMADEIISVIDTKTGDTTFDAYCELTYLDNCLRGGFPVNIGNKVFYMYSRKHGDIERDYNYFTIAPEFFTQGNASFRDICQNRRCDIMFTPYTGQMNVKTFLSLIQSDGFNPLKISEARYEMDEQNAEKYAPELKETLTNPFTPGSLADKLIDLGRENEIDEVVSQALTDSESMINAEFGEGYWTDHWIYTLDLVEAYLRVYPDKKEALLWGERDCTYFDTKCFVNPRRLRYEETSKGLRQYHPIRELPSKKNKGKLMTDPEGNVIKATAGEKLLLLCAIKFMTLDSYGMGVEMEGGRPGWYDALNGLPGLFGSSINESMELVRYLEFMIESMPSDGKMILSSEVAGLYKSIAALGINGWQDMESWNALNDIKEAYREATIDGFSGKTEIMEASYVKELLSNMRQTAKRGIARARALGNGKMPAYFAFDAVDYSRDEAGITVNSFRPVIVPRFLESYVHNLRLKHSDAKKKELYNEVRDGLYDSKLKMYKVNESLDGASFELGRCKAFTPGWLENESIWLHMEYKYLLELIKNGLYKEFIEDFHTCAVPFLDPDVYGRSVLENSSFIASSVNPNPKIHGRGFVARLSGSTAEFIDMYEIMMFGKSLFSYSESEGLIFAPKPLIPSYLVGESLTVGTKLLGTTEVIYKLPSAKDYIPGEYSVTGIKIDGRLFAGSYVGGDEAEAIRSGIAKKIEITLG
ncbi:MAG: hypothetical protein IJ757_00185 [Clostridiales bacterium]|nr:hypothetical protein [Clostridiales bacterium]